METTPPFEFRPHPEAPIFSGSIENSRKILSQIVAEIKGGNFPASEAMRLVLRQAALASLWFYLKVVAGYNGPYERLNTGLHLEMCNFRQSDYCMAPAAHAWVFLPRNHRKTTIFTHGADGWELRRNKDEKIALIAATASKGTEFKRVTQRQFDSNEFAAWIFPEDVPGPSAPRWNDREFVLPSRTRFATEPSMGSFSVGGAIEGGHYTLINPDDLVGLDDLDAERVESIDMERKIAWYQTNSRALLDDWNTSRIVGAATRYGIEDLYKFIVQDAKVVIGQPMDDAIIKPDGLWAIYNRYAVEDGEFIQPETMNKKEFERLMRDDQWTAESQYFNRPLESAFLEFKNYETKRCFLHWDDENGYVIHFPGDSQWEEEEDTGRLKDMDVAITLDLAGTEKPKDAKHTRTAVTVWAMDHRERYIALHIRAGFWSLEETYDRIAEACTRFKDYIRIGIGETNAMQKTILPLINAEMRKRDIMIYFDGQSATGDKDARIRNIVGLAYSKEKVYAIENEWLELDREKNLFPRAKFKKDILDATEKAFSVLIRPDSPEEIEEEAEYFEEHFASGRNSTTGY